MDSRVASSARTTLRAKIERYLQALLDQAQKDGVQNRLDAAVVRRLVVRDLGQILLEDLGD